MVAQVRGAAFEEIMRENDVRLVPKLHEDTVLCDTAVDDMCRWLRFRSGATYVRALPRLKSAIFKRATA